MTFRFFSLCAAAVQWHYSVFAFLAHILLLYCLPLNEVWSDKEAGCESFDVAVNLIYLIRTGISPSLSLPSLPSFLAVGQIQ